LLIGFFLGFNPFSIWTFPLAEISQGGIAHFPINKRHIGDLNWLMMRYPLKIKQASLWRVDLNEGLEHYKRREEIKAKISPEDPNITFKGNLFEFQKEGLSFLSHNRRCLLADEMGLGKTVMALAMISKREFPVVIVTPSHLMLQWKDEIERFLGDKVNVQILKGLNPKKNPMSKKADIYLVHYLILRGWAEEILKLDYKTIIFDEIQELRHHGSLKYHSAKMIAKDRGDIIGLSGTPIYNYGAEMWNVMNIIEPFCLGDWEFFTKEWCGRSGSVIVEEPELLGKYLVEEGLMLRRRKEDVLLELPPKRKIVQEIELDRELYVKLIDKSIKLSYKIPTMVTKRERKLIGSMVLDAVNNARRSSGIAKAGHVCDFVKLIVESGVPCLLFAYHHSVIDIYLRLLGKYMPRCITGRETREEKRDSIKEFMEGNTDLLIINLRTTSGLNLQRARCVIFGELDWSPAVHKQAEDRIHRIGQKDSVLCYYLIAPTVSDEKIIDILGVKDWQFTEMMHDRKETKEDQVLSQRASNKFMKDILSDLQSEKFND